MSNMPETPTASLASAEPVPEDQLHHHRAVLARAAEERHPGAGWTVHQWWKELNEELFGRQMEPCRIQFEDISGQCFSGECRFGVWKREEDSIILDRSLLHRHGCLWRLYYEELGRKLVYDALLHQIVHQYIDAARSEEGGQKGKAFYPKHDTHLWIAEINRLSKALELESKAVLGISDSTEAEVAGDLLVEDEVALWPYLARKTGYYQTDPQKVISGLR